MQPRHPAPEIPCAAGSLQRPGIIALATTLVVASIALIAFAGCDRGATSSSNSATKPLVLIVSGDTAGWLTPCGCASNQSGGLLRRGTYVANAAKTGDVLLADAGGAAGGTSDYHKVKFEAILAGEKRMGLAAHNIGKSEAALGPAFLREVAKRLDVPLVSCNVDDAEGNPIGQRSHVVNAGGKRVLVTGVMSAKFTAEGVKVREPRQAVLDAIAPAAGTYDSLVVLAYLPQDELEALAASLPEADAVIGGPTGQSIAPRKIGPTLLASSTNKGKFLVELNHSSTGWDGKVIEMASTFPEDAGQQAGVQAYLAVLAEKDFPAAATGLAPSLPPGLPDSYRIAGSAACLSCHKDDHSVWAHSKHSHAWDTIQAKGFHVDSYCQSCHTTGYGLPGGFESRKASAAFVGVGCENCHGPSQAHALNPKTRTTFVASDQCVTCHDHENSPSFAYNVYWPRVLHGKGAKPQAAQVGAQ